MMSRADERDGGMPAWPGPVDERTGGSQASVPTRSRWLLIATGLIALGFLPLPQDRVLLNLYYGEGGISALKAIFASILRLIVIPFAALIAAAQLGAILPFAKTMTRFPWNRSGNCGSSGCISTSSAWKTHVLLKATGPLEDMAGIGTPARLQRSSLVESTMELVVRSMPGVAPIVSSTSSMRRVLSAEISASRS